MIQSAATAHQRVLTGQAGQTTGIIKATNDVGSVRPMKRTEESLDEYRPRRGIGAVAATGSHRAVPEGKWQGAQTDAPWVSRREREVRVRHGIRTLLSLGVESGNSWLAWETV